MLCDTTFLKTVSAQRIVLRPVFRRVASRVVSPVAPLATRNCVRILLKRFCIIDVNFYLIAFKFRFNLTLNLHFFLSFVRRVLTRGWFRHLGVVIVNFDSSFASVLLPRFHL